MKKLKLEIDENLDTVHTHTHTHTHVILNKLTSNSAITLVALVITIIVLLILAGVVLNTVLGDDGIIQKAQLAREKTDDSQQKEKENLENLENEVEKYTSRNTSSTTTEIDIKNVELDYDHKVDLSSYNSADNQYTIPSNGIIMFSGHLYDKSVLSYLYVNDIQLTIIGGATGYNGGFWNAGAYSQFITKNSKVYTDGGGILDVQYFIPFK